MVDKVYDDSMMGFDHSARLATGLTNRYFDALAAKIHTSGAGVPVVVFNPLGWSRTDVAEGDVAFSEPGVMSFAVVDPDGKPVATQTVNQQRNADGSIRQARVVFVARGGAGVRMGGVPRDAQCEGAGGGRGGGAIDAGGG